MNLFSRARRGRQDYDPVQAEAGRDRDDDPHHRVQRGDGGVQEHLLHGVGRGRTGQDQAAVEALLPEHAGVDLRGGLQRQGEDRRGAGGVAKDGAYAVLVRAVVFALMRFSCSAVSAKIDFAKHLFFPN